MEIDPQISVGSKPGTDSAKTPERFPRRRSSLAYTNAAVRGCCLGFLARTKRDKPPFHVDKSYLQDETGLFGDTFTMDYLLHPPPSISFQMGKQLKDTVKTLGNHVGDCGRFNPGVFVCHSVGRRVHDSASTGPGVFFAAAILRLLFSYGVPCLSPLMVNEKFQQSHRTLHSNDPHALIMKRLASRTYTCNVMVVVETQALYEDQKCLEQIACAIRCNEVELMRVRFEDDFSMPREMQWACVEQATCSKSLMQMREEVLRYMDESMTVQANSPDDPKLLMQVIPYTANKSNRSVNWNPEPDPWTKKQTRQETWVEHRLDDNVHGAGNAIPMQQGQRDGQGVGAEMEDDAMSFVQQPSVATAWSEAASMKSVKKWLHQCRTAFLIHQPEVGDELEANIVEEPSRIDNGSAKVCDGEKKLKSKGRAKAKAGAGKRHAKNASFRSAGQCVSLQRIGHNRTV